MWGSSSTNKLPLSLNKTNSIIIWSDCSVWVAILKHKSEKHLANQKWHYDMGYLYGLLHGSELISPLQQGKAILWISAFQMEKAGSAKLAHKTRKCWEDVLNNSISEFAKFFLSLGCHNSFLCCCWTIRLQCCPCSEEFKHWGLRNICPKKK